MGRPAIDLTGQRFGKLTVLERDFSISGQGKRARWICKCDCGITKSISSASLIDGQQSCGCKVVEDHLTHGFTGTRLYNVWNCIKQRCGNPNNKNYVQYGGRGITICDEWKKDFVSFRNWAIENGYDESAVRGKCTIDRIDNDGNYTPENCRVVDMKTQANNTRKNVKIQYSGKEMTLSEIARDIGVSRSTLWEHYKKGNIEKYLEKEKEIM